MTESLKDLMKQPITDRRVSHGAAEVLSRGGMQGTLEACPRANVSIIVVVPFEDERTIGFNTSATITAHSQAEQKHLLAAHALVLSRAPLGWRLVAALTVVSGIMLPWILPDPRPRNPFGTLFWMGIGLLFTSLLVAALSWPPTALDKSMAVIGLGLMLVSLLRGGKRERKEEDR